MYINVCAKHIYRSRGISLCPLTRCGIVLIPVVLVQISDFWHEGVIRVGIGEERADREKHFGDCECGWPLILEDVEADGAVAVDVTMVNFRCECDLRGLEGIVRWEDDVQEEDATWVGRVLGAHDRCLPGELVWFISGTGRAVDGRISSEVDQFFLNSFESHSFCD